MDKKLLGIDPLPICGEAPKMGKKWSEIGPQRQESSSSLGSSPKHTLYVGGLVSKHKLEIVKNLGTGKNFPGLKPPFA